MGEEMIGSRDPRRHDLRLAMRSMKKFGHEIRTLDEKGGERLRISFI